MLAWKYVSSNKGMTLFYVLLGDKTSFRKLSTFLKWYIDHSFRDSQWISKVDLGRLAPLTSGSLSTKSISGSIIPLPRSTRLIQRCHLLAGGIVENRGVCTIFCGNVTRYPLSGLKYSNFCENL